MAKDGEDLTKYNVHSLMALPESARNKYCIDTMMAVADGLEQVTKVKGKILQIKAMKKFLKSLREKKEEVMTPIIYTIKPEFRDTYIELLQRFSDALEGI
jgi:hypothetical protein